MCSLTRWSVGRAVLAAVDGPEDPLSLHWSRGQGLISTAQSQVSLCRALYTPRIILWPPHSWTRQSVLFLFHVRGEKACDCPRFPSCKGGWHLTGWSVSQAGCGGLGRPGWCLWPWVLGASPLREEQVTPVPRRASLEDSVGVLAALMEQSSPVGQGRSRSQTWV